ncbi:MAG: cold shock domain-containing protein [Deinococcus-Thermus bacterium]|jgi:ribosomal subunit interface protein|nr:cold shock domain-containing protein [Deinococcota bacterium]
MDVPLEIAFRNMESSDFVEARVREKVDKLERFFDHINSMRVVVEAPAKAQHQGGLYQVTIEIGVPGKRLMVDRARPHDHAHEDVYVAIRDAFDAATRQLEDYAATLRGDVKTLDHAPHAKVIRMFADQGFGFVLMPDGEEVYFDAGAVEGQLEDLTVGDEVRVSIADDRSQEGTRASHVAAVGKQGHRIETTG